MSVTSFLRILFVIVMPTESSLSLEARPPPEAEFFDAFQKLKHALILLVSRLQHYLNLLVVCVPFSITWTPCHLPCLRGVTKLVLVTKRTMDRQIFVLTKGYCSKRQL